MATPLGSGGSSDPTPPTVAITAPAANAQVSDIVNGHRRRERQRRRQRRPVLRRRRRRGRRGHDGAVRPPVGHPRGRRTAPTRSPRERGMPRATRRCRPPVTVNVANTSSFQNEVLATGFNLPTSIEFLPDGRMLVVELAGKIWVLPPPYTTPDPTPFLQITNIGSAGVQQGIYDIALDPSFATNHFYYVFYTLGSPNRDRLSRFTANATNTGTVAGSELRPVPGSARTPTPSTTAARSTSGTTASSTSRRASTSSRARLRTVDESYAEDPPHQPGRDRSRPIIRSTTGRAQRRLRLGVGSPQPVPGLLRRPTGGSSSATSAATSLHRDRGGGPRGPGRELRVARPVRGRARVRARARSTRTPTTGATRASPAASCTTGRQFPAAYRGSYFFADYTQNWIRRLTSMPTATSLASSTSSRRRLGRRSIRRRRLSHRGARRGALLRRPRVLGRRRDLRRQRDRPIRYLQSNQAPVAVSSATRRQARAPLAVSFSSAGSSDPEGQPLTYSWTFGDGGTSTAANPTHTYTQAGQYSDAAHRLRRGQQHPVAADHGQRGAEAHGDHSHAAGRVLLRRRGRDLVSGDADRPDDGSLPASAFTWNVDFLHEGHVHPGTPRTGVESGSFTTPTTGSRLRGDTRYHGRRR